MSAAILLSGGIDSVSLAYWKRPEYAIYIDYGQAPAETELRISKHVAEAFGIPWQVIRTQIRELGTGFLADSAQISVAPTPEWWPFRNQFLVTIGAMCAIKRGLSEIMIGTVKSDTCHLDNSRTFIRLLNRLVSLQEGGILVSAPAHSLTTAELVKKSQIPISMLGWTHSCHTGNFACGSCRGCQKRIEIFESIATGD
jgi:7-cyano-7-deazaguanine synthase